MSDYWLAAFGISSAIISIISIIPYILDIFKRKTKPERATWWIWLMLSSVAFFAQVSAGATWSLLMTVAQTIVVGAVAFLSIKYGFGKFARKDLLSIIFAIFGIVLWKFTSEPITALLIVVAVDLSAFWLTLTKTWKEPQTETFITWFLSAFGGFFGLLAVGGLNLTQIVYPLYIALANSSMVFIIIYRRKVVKVGKANH